MKRRCGGLLALAMLLLLAGCTKKQESAQIPRPEPEPAQQEEATAADTSGAAFTETEIREFLAQKAGVYISGLSAADDAAMDAFAHTIFEKQAAYQTYLAADDLGIAAYSFPGREEQLCILFRKTEYLHETVIYGGAPEPSPDVTPDEDALRLVNFAQERASAESMREICKTEQELSQLEQDIKEAKAQFAVWLTENRETLDWETELSATLQFCVDGSVSLEILQDDMQAMSLSYVGGAVLFPAVVDAQQSGTLPTPSASMFGLTGTEAALYDAAVSWKYPREDSDIVLPSLRVRGSFEEDGKTVVVCDIRYAFYCGWTGPDWEWNWSREPTYLRAEFETQNDAEVCTGFEFFPGGMVSDWVFDKCGKLAVQDEYGAWVLPETTESWFPTDGDMLRQYLTAAGVAQEPARRLLRDEALREKFTADASQVTDEDLLEIFRGIDLALVGHGNDFFDDPRALSSEQLYALFFRWTHYAALEPYQDPESGYYSIPREVIERTLACYLDRYNFDITQCPGYDAESGTVVDRMPEGYGGDPNVKLASRTLDGNTLTCVVDFYPMELDFEKEPEPIDRKEYTLCCYAGGFYLESIRDVPLKSE